MDIELVVFDMAGTTVADCGNVNKAFRDAFFSAGIDVSENEVNKVMGYRKIDAVTIIVDQYTSKFNGNSNTTIARIHEQFNREMVSFYKNDTSLKPLPFAEEIFQQLQARGIKVALNTGFTREITDAILKRLEWEYNSSIDKVICSDEVPEGRPHAYMIQSIMQQLGLSDVTKVVKVGDTEVDVLEGQNAGCGIVVGVTTGAYSHEQLAKYKPDFIISSLQELPAIIQ